MITGSLWSRESFGKVLSVSNHSVEVENEDGMRWTIDRHIFDKEFVVADDVDRSDVVSRTALIDDILKNPRTAITIVFRKKVDPKDVLDAALAVCNDEAGHKLKTVDEKKLKKAIKDAMQGEPRTMLCRHYSQFDQHGRLKVYDMEAQSTRLVDPRTIESAIIRGVQYTVK